MIRKNWKSYNYKSSLNEIVQLEEIAQKWKWMETDIYGNKFVDVFLARLSKFEVAQRKLILCLTKDFFVIEPNRICGEFYRLFKNWISQVVLVNKDLVICPLLAPKDFGKQKSSTALWYNISRNIDDAIKMAASNYNVIFKDSPEKVDCSKCNTMELVLIDDFVGTGNNACDAILYFEKLGWDASHIFLLSIVMMNQGKTFLGNKGYNAITLNLCYKGITDSKIKDSNSEKLMEKIESKLGVAKKYKFGYGRSEALVSTPFNTPNNTFPFYWWENDAYSKPPFHRGYAK